MKQKGFWKTLRRTALWLGGLCLAGVLAVCLINLSMVFSSRGRMLSREAAADLEADCILVLGAGVYANGAPSPMLADRLSQAVALYQLGASDRLLMSGDHGRADYDEVNVMKSFATAHGIPSQHVFMDHAGFSTYESLYRAREVFQAKKIVIVTQRYHLYRALYLARRMGLEAWGVAAEEVTYPGWQYRELREVAARVKDYFSGIWLPPPTYLGQAIPISGNGDWTND